MKKPAYFTILFGVISILIMFWFYYSHNSRDNRLQKKGADLINTIELFSAKHKRLPNSLEDLGIKEFDGLDELYYDKRDSLCYTVSYGTTLGESMFYYSDTKHWESKYRAMNCNDSAPKMVK